MHSSTTSYITLQNLYKAQFRTDLQLYITHVEAVLERIGLDKGAVSIEEIESFARNTGGVMLIKGSSLMSRKEVQGELSEAIGALRVLVFSSLLFCFFCPHVS
jgi:amyloid beta precursor protein binding protein 1